MDPWVMIAVKIFFIVAAAAPPLLVILYRALEVPSRRDEVVKMMNCAFEGPDKEACEKILANNPYISNPKQTFNLYHTIWRYVLPWCLLSALTASSAYMVYSSVRHHIELHAATTAAKKASIAKTTAGGAPAPPSSAAGTSNQSKDQENTPTPDAVPPLVIVMALAGGYIWAVFQICARSRSAELSPNDLYEIDLGLLAAVPVGIAFSLITEQLDGARTFAAFAASAFPLREVQRLIRQYALRKTLASADTVNSTSRPEELHLGSAIEGLSDQTLARLSELRINTVLDMAYCDPIKVMVQTGFPLPVIIDWVDQSLWALYVGDLKSKFDKRGIRCSLDACEFVDLHLKDANGNKKTEIKDADKQALEALAKEMNDCNPVLLQDLLFRIESDPQVLVLRKLWYPLGVPKDLKATGVGA